MTHDAPGRWLVEPFIMGTAEQFAAAHEALVSMGYTEAAVCAEAGIESIYALAALPEREQGFQSPDSPLAVAVQLFIDANALPTDLVERTIGRRARVALETIGLLQPFPGDASRCASFLALYPTEGLYVASDRVAHIADVSTVMPADIVYAAITPETERFVRLMPRTPCRDYLELCSGTGIAALVAAQHFATEAWAIDLTERSTRFAAFNAALNGLDSLHALEGDLYAPVAGQTFDMITAHPPYVPSFETTMVFRDGGEDGEHVTRRIIAGLAEYLRPGGTFYCDCMMTDRADAPLEQRIRAMLGSAHDEFDVLVGQVGIIAPEALLAGTLAAGRITEEMATAQRSRFAQLGVERFVNTGFLIARHAAARPAITRRRVVSPATRAEHFPWFLQAASTVQQAAPRTATLLDARLTAPSGTELVTRSVLRAGRWTTTAGSVGTQTPFALQADCPSWFGTFLTWCDGKSTGRDLLNRLRNAALVPDAAGEDDFGILVGELAEGGFIELDNMPLPGHAEFQERRPITRGTRNTSVA